MIENSKFEVDHCIQSCEGKTRDQCQDIDDVVNADPKSLRRSRGLRENAKNPHPAVLRRKRTGFLF
jgi:hypothetical protein